MSAARRAKSETVWKVPISESSAVDAYSFDGNVVTQFLEES